MSTYAILTWLFYAVIAVVVLGVPRRIQSWLRARRDRSRGRRSLNFNGLATNSRKGMALHALLSRDECRERLLADIALVEKNFTGRGGRLSDWPAQLRALADSEGTAEFIALVERAYTSVYSLAELEALADLKVRFPELDAKNTQFDAAVADAAQHVFKKLDGKTNRSGSKRSRVVTAAAL